MRVFKTRWLARFSRREGITDSSLCEAVNRAERGLIDAHLGGGLIKQRVARLGQGRSGGYRIIVGYHARKRAVFLLGFAKSERENIGDDELLSLREIAGRWLAADAAEIEKELTLGNLQEIRYGQEQENEQGGRSNPRDGR